MKILKGLLRTVVLHRALSDFKELQSSWSPLLSGFPNCPCLGPVDLLQEGPEALCWHLFWARHCAERNSTKPGLEQHPLVNVCIYTTKTGFSLLSWVCPVCFCGYWIFVTLEDLLFSTQILWTVTSSGCIISVIQDKSGLFSFLASTVYLAAVWTLSSLPWVDTFLCFVVSFSCRMQDWAN